MAEGGVCPAKLEPEHDQLHEAKLLRHLGKRQLWRSCGVPRPYAHERARWQRGGSQVRDDRRAFRAGVLVGDHDVQGRRAFRRRIVQPGRRLGGCRLQRQLRVRPTGFRGPQELLLALT